MAIETINELHERGVNIKSLAATRGRRFSAVERIELLVQT